PSSPPLPPAQRKPLGGNDERLRRVVEKSWKAGENATGCRLGTRDMILVIPYQARSYKVLSLYHPEGVLTNTLGKKTVRFHPPRDGLSPWRKRPRNLRGSPCAAGAKGTWGRQEMTAGAKKNLHLCRYGRF